jgi:hypothetical protein
MIVIENDERSEYYHDYCKPSWESVGITVNRFNAITPKTLHRQKDLKFAKYSTSPKYVVRGLKVEITETERACFYSHFRLWQESVFTNKPILILEHDCILQDPSKLWCNNLYGITFYDRAAMGSYIIQPWFAKDLIEHMYGVEISNGPYSHIEKFAFQNNRMKELVNVKHDLFIPASDQVMSMKYGGTIDHYSNDKDEYKKHNFVMIP